MVMTPAIGLRLATAADCRRLWEWRNEPTVRAMSLNVAEIPYVDHERWFARKLGDPSTRILVVEDGAGRAIGYVRFDVTGAEAFINVCIDAAERGKGYGVSAIARASDDLVTTSAVRRVVAQVKQANAASTAAFTRAGFSVERWCTVSGDEVCELVYPGRAGGRV